MGLTLEDVRNALINAHGRQRRRAASTAPQQSLHASRPTTSSPSRAPTTTSILAYRNGAPVRVRDIGHADRAARRTASCAGWQNGQARHPADHLQAARRQRHRHGRRDQGAAAARWRPRSRPPIHVSTIVDRTQTIRASVTDVQFTLMLSVALVVMVIFLFLRNVWATIIPSVTVPLALVGTFAVMYLLGFSLDNLSLMALTIAVGFVVDDAIVMLENIYRHIEDGMPPMEAAMKGAGEIGFTIVSISISLIAVFIPLLLMGGIVGRLFREFAMTVAIAVVVSAFVSLTLTPMMCSRFLQPAARRSTAGCIASVEAVFDGMHRLLPAHAGLALRFQLHHAAGLPRDRDR